MAGTYEISESGDGKFWFVLKASNGQVILRSQQYASKGSAEGGIASVQANCGVDDRYERKVASDGRPFFNLLAANKQVIGTSQMYASEKSRDEGIASVKVHGPSTVVKEGDG